MGMITDYTENGKCTNCGSCCSNFLPLSDNEILRIEKYVKKHNIKEQRHNVFAGYDMTCPFRDDVQRKCLIYSVRPEICRVFMCNHSHEDIMKAKFDMHAIKKPIPMRGVFFNSKEDSDFLTAILRK